MRRVSFEQEVDCKELGTKIKGFVAPEVIKILKENSTVGKVLRGMEYRPDKIAEYYYNNSNFSWMIDFANGFTNGIKDYYSGREILIPDYNIVQSLLSSYVER